MTSKIKVDNINKVSDDSNIINKCSTNITVGANGDTVIIPNGVTEQVQSGGAIQVQSGGSVTIASGATITNNGTATGFGGGAVLQVKTGMYYGSTAPTFTTATPTWVGTVSGDYATAGSITVTPASTASVFHVYLQCPMYCDDYGGMKLYRNIDAGSYTQLTGANHYGGSNMYVMFELQHWDAPATTDDVIYRMYVNAYGGGNIEPNQIGSANGIYGGMITTVTEYDGSKVTIAED